MCRFYSVILLWLLLTGAPMCLQASGVDNVIGLADHLQRSGNLTQAINTYGRLVAMYESGCAQEKLSEGLQRGGNCCMLAGRYIEALRFYTLAIEMARRCKNTKVECTSMSNIGAVYAIFNDYERAIYYFEQAFSIALQHHRHSTLSVVAINLVKMYCRLGDTASARKYLNEEIKFPLADQREQHFKVLVNQGIIARTEKNYKGALYYLQQAADLARIHRLDPNFQSEAYLEIATTWQAMQHLPQAASCYREVVGMATRGRYLEQLNTAYLGLSKIYTDMHRADSAQHYQSLYLALSDSVFNQRQFNDAKDALFQYENHANEEHISTLESTIKWLLLAVGVAIVMLAVIYHYTRRLRQAQRLLVRKNEDLIRQNDESRRLREDYALKLKQLELDTASRSNEPSHCAKAVEARESIDENRQAELLKDILSIMDRIDVVANPEFNLAALAKMVNSNTKYVSAVINFTYGKNFRTFLNEYRIREASHMLADKQGCGNLTIAAIASAVGFASANGFVNAFKKAVGVTPSVYKKLSQERKA